MSTHSVMLQRIPVILFDADIVAEKSEGMGPKTPYRSWWSMGAEGNPKGKSAAADSRPQAVHSHKFRSSPVSL